MLTNEGKGGKKKKKSKGIIVIAMGVGAKGIYKSRLKAVARLCSKMLSSLHMHSLFLSLSLIVTQTRTQCTKFIRA